MTESEIDNLIAEVLNKEFVAKPRAYQRDRVRTLVAELQKRRPQGRQVVAVPKHCGRLNYVYACFLPPGHDGEHKPERYAWNS